MVVRGCSCLVIIYIIFSLLPFSVIAGNLNDGSADVVVRDVSVCISASTSFCATGDVLITGDGKFINQGEMWFSNTLPAELRFLSDNSGDGKYIFSGVSDCILRGGPTWTKVLLKTKGGSLFLDGNLTVKDSLVLNTGVINTGISKVILQNDFPNSLIFNNKKENDSYIFGSLDRRVAENGIYYFPVGDNTGFHPFMIHDVSAKGNINVSYDSNISEEWRAVIQNASFSVENVGGWKVDSPVSFYSGLSFFDNGTPLSVQNGKYSVLYAADEMSFAVNYQKDMSFENRDFYVLGSKRLSGGIYTLASEGAVRLLNFIFITGKSNSHFEIPEISKYSRVELSVFNRWGQKIYDDRNYYNGFNCANVPQGTYFYELRLHQGNSVELIRNFIEVKREK